MKHIKTFEIVINETLYNVDLYIKDSKVIGIVDYGNEISIFRVNDLKNALEENKLINITDESMKELMVSILTALGKIDNK